MRHWLPLILSISATARAQQEHQKPIFTEERPIQTSKPIKARDLCKDPWKTICESSTENSSVPSQADIHKKIAAAHGGDPYSELIQRLSSNNEPFALTSYAKLAIEAQDAVMAEWAKRGVTENQFTQRINEIKSVLMRQYQDSPKALSTLHNIKIDTASTLAKTGNPESWFGFYLQCGIDSLVEQAFYADDTNTLTICPGYFLFLLKEGGDASTVTQMAAHEIGHAIGPQSRVLDTARYQKYIQCIDQSTKVSELRPLPDVIAYYRDIGTPAKRKYLETLKAQDPRDEETILALEDSLANTSQTLDDFQATLNYQTKLFGHLPTLAESHSMELMADAESSIAMADLATKQQLKHQNAAQSVRSQLHFFCLQHFSANKQKIFELAYGPLIDDGTHPPDAYRIKRILSNPQLRKALGCKAASAAQWCAP